MLIPVMTFNIQHGIDFVKVLELRKELSLMTEEEQKEWKKAHPYREDPSVIRLDKMAAVIREAGAKIVALNEVRNASDAPCFTDQAKEMSELTGLPYYYFGQALIIHNQGPYGNALLSAYPFVSVETIAIPDPLVKDEDAYYETRCIIKAVLDISSEESGNFGKEGQVDNSDHPKTLTVLVTHMGLAKQEARNAVATVLKQVEEGQPTILMGDFNLLPDSEILQPLFPTFTDAAALLPEGTCSWPSNDPVSKIDYVMSAGPVTFKEAAVLEKVVSDHRPHFAVIEV